MFKLENYASLPYRDDIQGLRAVGALTIMIFHIWMNKVSGGVDIFIVVSGYLITSVYIRNIERYGYKGILSFLINILRRVSASTILVVMATAMGVYFISPGFEQNTIFKEAIASLLHLENIQLIRKSTSYLDSANSPSPFQQFWALSAQVQMYFIMAFLLAPVVYRCIVKRDLKYLVLTYVVLLLLSFAYANYAVHVDASKAYFNPLARGWEFIAGGLVYLLSPNIKLNQSSSNILGLLGIALIFVAALLLPRGALYPAYPALLPVLAAIFILIAGQSVNSSSAKLLSLKPLVILGGFSFTIYLWHWPLLTFYKSYYFVESVGMLPGLLIMAAAIIMAFATYTWWETIFEKVPKDKYVLNLASAAVLSVLGVAVVIGLLKLSGIQLERDINIVLADYASKEYRPLTKAGAASHADLQIPMQELKVSKSILPEEYKLSECHQNNLSSKILLCTRVAGDQQSPKLLVVGSSHIVQWLPALKDIAAQHGFKLDVMTKMACPLGITEDLDATCKTWNTNILDEIVALAPDYVITMSTRTFWNGAEAVTDGLLSSLEYLYKNNIPVIGIRDNPRYSFDATSCALANHKDKGYNTACTMPRKGFYAIADPGSAFPHLISSIDMSEAYCSSDTCYAAYDDNLIYRDQDHLSVPYVYTLRGVLETRLLAVMQRLAYAGTQ